MRCIPRGVSWAEHVEEEEEEIAKDAEAGPPSGAQLDGSCAGSGVLDAGLPSVAQQKDTSGGDKVKCQNRKADKGNKDPKTEQPTGAQSKGSGTYLNAVNAAEKRGLHHGCSGGCHVGHCGQGLPGGRGCSDHTLTPNGVRRFCMGSQRTGFENGEGWFSPVRRR